MSVMQGQTDTGSGGAVTQGSATSILATPRGELHTSEATLRDLLLRLIHEVRLLRLGLCAAPDSVCIDIEGELTPVSISEE